MIEQVRELGPLDWPNKWEEVDDLEAAFESLIAEHAEAMEVPA
jgi:hypothetical protein